MIEGGQSEGGVVEDDDLGEVKKRREAKKGVGKGKRTSNRGRGEYLKRSGLTKRQKDFCDAYKDTGDRRYAIKKGYGDIKRPSQLAWGLLQMESVRNYICNEAQVCAEVQTEMMMSKKTPAAVRNDIAKFKLGIAGIKG